MYKSNIAQDIRNEKGPGFRLLLGRARTGKSTAILHRIAVSGGQRRQLLIVPEQASHETERRLCNVAGNQVSLYAEVLSFTRLASRVFALSGGLAAPTLDAGGRLLLMYAALKSVSNSLTVFSRPSKKPAFLTGLLATLDECKQYQISPDALARTGIEVEGQEGEKLKDLGLIFGAYDALAARTAADPRDRLTRLAQGLHDCGYAEGIDVYVDGFTDFTPQQGLVLKELMRQAVSVTVALTCDNLDKPEGESGIFTPARRTVAYLLQLARGLHIDPEIENLLDCQWHKAESLVHLEENLFVETPDNYRGASNTVGMFSALTARSETEWTASEILRLVRDEGCRYRDITVVVRGFDRYAPLVEEVFARYGIPVFLDEMTDILQKPVFAVEIGRAHV